MAPIRAIFPPDATRYRASLSGYFPRLIKDLFALPTLLALGGLGQAVVSFVLPPRFALLPLALLLLRAVVLTALELASPAQYASKLGVIPGRTAAQLPNASYNSHLEESSPFGSTLADKGVVVFHLSARYNHPLGAMSPGSKEFVEQFVACSQELLARAKDFGCLGGTRWRADETPSKNTILNVFYFRDVEGLNRFAHGAVHRQAWDWYNNKFVKKWGYAHIGISHETFCAPAGGYESIYANMPPVLMAAGSAGIKNEATGREEWVRTVVDALGPTFRSQYARMGKRVD